MVEIKRFSFIFIISIFLFPHVSETVFTREEFYNPCDSGTLCFGMGDEAGPSPDCLSPKDCRLAVSVFKEGHHLKFRMIGELEYLLQNPNQYMAVGISFDDTMGNDIVSACYTTAFKSGIVFSWNVNYYSANEAVRTNEVVQLAGDKYDPISNRWVSLEHDPADLKNSLLCEWTQFWKYTTTSGLIFDFLSDLQQFYLLVANGTLANFTSLQEEISPEKSTYFLSAHGHDHYSRKASETPILTRKSIFGKDYISNAPEPSSGTINFINHIIFLYLFMSLFTDHVYLL